jgi:HSP20 family protein
MSSRSNPFEEIERMFDRLSRQFEETPWGRSPEEWPSAGGRDALAADVADTGDEFVVTFDIPGFDRKEVTVEVTDHTLHVEADREETTDESEGEDAEATYIRRERTRRSLRRDVRLPDEIDPEDVSARLHNGVLTVHIAKAEPTRTPHRIEIEDE